MAKAKNTIAERIREHLLDQLKSGKLSAGDKLPSYSQLCKRFSVSYASVQYAFKEFEKDGLVERVQGVGTFLKGSDELEVEMFLDTSAFPIEKLQPLVNLAVSAKGLHLNVRIRPLKEAFSIQKLSSKRRVVITQDIVESVSNPGSLLDLSSFSDYRFVVGQLKGFTTARPCNVALPFHSFTYQMAFNPLILQKVGFNAKKMSGETMEWWSEYAAACRVAGTPPGIKHWSKSGLASFGNLNHLIFPLLIRERGKFKNLLSLPVFDTESGRTMLRIMNDLEISEATASTAFGFHSGKLGVELALGSWFAVHRATKFNLPEDAFKIIPYRFGDRKICSTTLQYLRPFVCADIKPDEKERVWELLKIFVSKEFQLELCAMSGMVSIRKEITPKEHPWNNRADFAAFFPNDDDIVILNDIFNERVKAAISALFEQHLFHGADPDQILRSMDLKVKSMLEPT